MIKRVYLSKKKKREIRRKGLWWLPKYFIQHLGKLLRGGLGRPREERRLEEERADRRKDIHEERLNQSEIFGERKNCDRREFEIWNLKNNQEWKTRAMLSSYRHLTERKIRSRYFGASSKLHATWKVAPKLWREVWVRFASEWCWDFGHVNR